mmetsp:Transcript_74191/g.143611  ORF Transcript_74191/g.143611 Transcript_74191/m.143611 type:complete len:263 (+) Transcript_74191:76-864(+)
MSATCWERPPLERLRLLCIACLVLDSLFVLIYCMTALSSQTETARTTCHEAHGYKWHMMVVGTFVISAFVALGGSVTHASVVCNSPNTERQLVGVARFAHCLIFWTFAAAVIEAVNYRNEPPECAQITAHASMQSELPSAEGYHEQVAQANAIWQVTCTMLWLCWVMSTAAAGVISRRCIPLLGEAASNPCFGAPQTVGMPASELGPDTHVGIPMGGNQSSVPSVAIGATGQGVAQGLPVNGAAGSASSCSGKMDDECGQKC